jgi:hypothetical protein
MIQITCNISQPIQVQVSLFTSQYKLCAVLNTTPNKRIIFCIIETFCLLGIQFSPFIFSNVNFIEFPGTGLGLQQSQILVTVRTIQIHTVIGVCVILLSQEKYQDLTHRSHYLTTIINKTFLFSRWNLTR